MCFQSFSFLFSFFFFFFFNDTATTEIYTLSLHDALPILANSPRSWSHSLRAARPLHGRTPARARSRPRSEEHTSELQSQFHLVCRLLLEKKKSHPKTCLSQKKKKRKTHT